MSLNFSNVKSITIPEGEVKEIRDSGGTPIWKGSWLYTITIGDYVSSVRYSDDHTNWTTITSNTTVEIDSGKSLYIQAERYNVDDMYWDYTPHNFDITRTEANAGGELVVYQTRTRIYYTTTITAGDYVSTVKAKVNSGNWVTPASSVSVQHLYEDTVYWSAEDYNTSDAQWTYSGTLSGDFNRSQGQSITVFQTRTLNSYTITWKNYDGTVLETDYNVSYGSTPSYNSSTPTKPSDNTYTYSFSSWSPSVATVTGNATYTAQFSSTYIDYTITWKWQSSYGSWTTTTQTYHYNDTPSRTVPGDVTSGNNKQVCTGWDSLAKVTASRTITAVYKQQYYATISGTRCSANISTGWYDSGTTITWTANSYCAFNSTGTTTTQTASITSGTSYSKSADYIYVTISGTRCSANYSTGWHPYNRTVTWTANSAYAFNTSNTTTDTANLTSPGGSYSKSADYVKRYTLTISVSGSYGSYSVSRTSSPYQRASTGTLSNGATIYYGDVLSGSSSNGTQYGSWDCTSADLTLPTGSWNGGATTSPSITLTAKNSATANLYRRPSWSGDWTHLSSNWGTGATTSLTDTGLAFSTTYYYHVARYQNRNYWVWSASSSNYTGTNGVTGNVTANFTFTQGSAQTESNWIGGGETPISTGSQATYTITWQWRDSYDHWTTTTETYNYGATPSRSNPSTVTSGNYRRVPTGWNDLSAVYSNRTITQNYRDEWYVSISSTNCSCNYSSNWYSSAFTATWTANSYWAFNSSGGNTTSTYISGQGSYSGSPSYRYVTFDCTNCSASHSNGWYSNSSTLSGSFTANEYYIFANNTRTLEYTVYGNSGPQTRTGSANAIGSAQFEYGSGILNNNHQLRYWRESSEDYDTCYTGLYVVNKSPYNVNVYVSFNSGGSTASANLTKSGGYQLFSVSRENSYYYPSSATIYIRKYNSSTYINSFTVYFGSAC